MNELALLARVLAPDSAVPPEVDAGGEPVAEALGHLLLEDRDGSLARRHRAGPTLALRCAELGLDGPALGAWRQDLLRSTAQHLALEDLMERTAEALADADVPWAPIKGLDLAARVYSSPEERPTSDLDLLITRSDLDRARRALAEAGFVSLSDGRRQERYLREEGYAWQARGPKGGLLELHFRLWGSVDAELGEALFRAARCPAPGEAPLPAGGRRLPLAHAFVLAAVHAFLDAPPRGLHAWRDLAQIGRRGPADLHEEVTRLTREHDLQVQVHLAARVAADHWDERSCTLVADALAGELRFAERQLSSRHSGRRGRKPEVVPLSRIVLARALSRRRSRHGLGKLIQRRLWAHAGIVATGTDAGWPWILRRLWYQCRVAGLEGPAAGLARLAPAPDGASPAETASVETSPSARSRP